MKAIIVGAGEVGYHLADRLSREGHEITLVERDAGRESHLKDRINASVVTGSGASASLLERAGIADAELFIAVTDVDEVNMFACLLARQYNVPHKIGRVNSIEYTHAEGKLNADKLGIELLINPQYVVAEEICEIVEYRDAVEAAEFAEGRVVFLSYPVEEGNPFVGKALKDLGLSQGTARLVVTSIKRGEKTIIPHGNDVLEKNDVISIVCIKADLPEIRKQFGFKSPDARNVFILGGGHVGYEVANRLSDGKHNIKIIDNDNRHCRELAEKLEDVLVLCTDATDVDTLKAEGIQKADAFIAVTSDDQSNILGSLLAKKYGCKRAITLVNQPELGQLAKNLGINAVISPRLSTASAILKYIRRGKVLSMVEQSDAEVLELQLPEKSKIINQPIRNIQLPKGAIIGAIVRESGVVIPSGDDQLCAEDRVIVFTLLESIPQVEHFFS